LGCSYTICSDCPARSSAGSSLLLLHQATSLFLDAMTASDSKPPTAAQRGDLGAKVGGGGRDEEWRGEVEGGGGGVVHRKT